MRNSCDICRAAAARYLGKILLPEFGRPAHAGLASRRFLPALFPSPDLAGDRLRQFAKLDPPHALMGRQSAAHPRKYVENRRRAQGFILLALDAGPTAPRHRKSMRCRSSRSRAAMKGAALCGIIEILPFFDLVSPFRMARPPLPTPRGEPRAFDKRFELGPDHVVGDAAHSGR